MVLDGRVLPLELFHALEAGEQGFVFGRVGFRASSRADRLPGKSSTSSRHGSGGAPRSGMRAPHPCP